MKHEMNEYPRNWSKLDAQGAWSSWWKAFEGVIVLLSSLGFPHTRAQASLRGSGSAALERANQAPAWAAPGLLMQRRGASWRRSILGLLQTVRVSTGRWCQWGLLRPPEGPPWYGGPGVYRGLCIAPAAMRVEKSGTQAFWSAAAAFHVEWSWLPWKGAFVLSVEHPATFLPSAESPRFGILQPAARFSNLSHYNICIVSFPWDYKELYDHVLLISTQNTASSNLTWKLHHGLSVYEMHSEYREQVV